MKKIAIAAAYACLVCTGSTVSVQAADFSFAGKFATGNDLQPFEFDLSAPALVTLTTWTFAGGTNAAGESFPAGGFDPVVSLFDATGTLLQFDDDGSDVANPDNGLSWDSLIQADLAAGRYQATLTQFPNFPNGPDLAAGFCCGAPDVSAENSFWALDILNVAAASQLPSFVITPVPEPEMYALLLAGLGVVTCAARRRRRV